MNNRVYKYFFREFLGYFTLVIFASTAIIWTIQAVNFLDLVTEDGHAFKIYLFYSFLILPKVITKLIPFAFLLSLIITIMKLENDNELIVLWTSGLNKIHIVNLIFRISIIIMFFQMIMSCFVNPETLNYSRSLLKNSQLQFIPSLLKEKRFNDTVEKLTVFVNKKNEDGTFENIFIKDEGTTLTNISTGGSGSTIFAKSGYVSSDEKNLVLFQGSIHKKNQAGDTNIIKFEKTIINLSNLTTKTTNVPKIQETSTLHIIRCFDEKNKYMHNCNMTDEYQKDLRIEINKRFGMPFYVPLISLIICFLLSSRRDKKISSYNKFIYFVIGFLVLVSAEITVRYSGYSFQHTAMYYLIPICMLPLTYLLLLRVFKYENLS